MSNLTKRNIKRFRSIIVIIGLVIGTNIAISYAGNKAGVSILPDSPRPTKAGVSILPDSPRPTKAGVSILPDSPRPTKAGVSILPDSPRPTNK